MRNDISVWSVFISSLGLQAGSVFSRTNINNPLWYLGVLMVCYIVFYITCTLSDRLSIKTYYLFVLMVCVGLGIQEYCIIFPFFNEDTARGYIAFFSGVLLSLYIKNYGVTKAECLISTATLALFALFLVIRPSVVTTKLQYVLTFMVFPSIVFLMESPGAKKLFRHKFWAKWSAVSFNVYIWHTPFFIALEVFRHLSGMGFEYGKLSTMYIALVIVQLFAVFSHRFIEIPLDKAVMCISQRLNARKQMFLRNIQAD